MIRKRIDINQILHFLGADVICTKGLIDEMYIDNLADVNRVNETTLDWINPAKLNKQEIAQNTKAKVLLVDETITPIEGKTLIVVKNPKTTLAQIGNHFFMVHLKPEIHPTAIIDPEAKIGKNVSIGAYSVIGKATIGDDTVIDANVRIYDSVTIGNHCLIEAGVVLGGAGFGFEKDIEGNRFRFPQLGSLIIKDYVEIGPNSTIDRGALSDTLIGSYTKISSLCHIAHNNVIGNNVEITCNAVLSGGNVIEDDVWISPNVSLKGYIHVGKGAKIGLGSVVIRNIPSGEIWVGNPAHKLEK